MVDQIVEVPELIWPGATGSITPEARAALEEMRELSGEKKAFQDKAVSNLVSEPSSLSRLAVESYAVNGLRSVRTYGAKGDGTTDDTDAFAKAIEDGGCRILYIPAGTYRLAGTLPPVARPLKLMGAGQGVSSIACEPAGDEWRFKLSSGCEACDLSIDAGSDTSYAFTTMQAVSDVSVHDVTVTRGGLIETCYEVGWQGDITPDMIRTAMSRRVTIRRCTLLRFGDGRQVPSIKAGISLKYCSDSLVADNVLDNELDSWCGIQWWNGSADAAKYPNGGLAVDSTGIMARSVGKFGQNIRVTGNTVRHAGASSIWGTMTDGVIISGNTCEDSHDNMIGNEGNDNVIVLGNCLYQSVSTAMLYAQAWRCDSIILEGNTMTADYASEGAFIGAFGNSKGTPSGLNASSIVKGNTFTSVGDANWCVRYTPELPFGLIEGNVLVNTRLRLSGLYAGGFQSVKCVNNMFDYREHHPSDYASVPGGYGNILYSATGIVEIAPIALRMFDFSGNQIVCTDDTTDIPAISVAQVVGGGMTRITGNYIQYAGSAKPLVMLTKSERDYTNVHIIRDNVIQGSQSGFAFVDQVNGYPNTKTTHPVSYMFDGCIVNGDFGLTRANINTYAPYMQRVLPIVQADVTQGFTPLCWIDWNHRIREIPIAATKEAAMASENSVGGGA